MILKAGTYRFNDEVTFDKEVIETNVNGFITFPLIQTLLPPEAQIAVNSITSTDYGIFSANVHAHDILKINITGVLEGDETTQDIVLHANYTEPIMGWLYETYELEPYILQDVIITKDYEASEDFAQMFITHTNYNEVNAKPLAEITYNGETIAQLNAGETATLKCKDLPMASDVVVKVNKVEEPVDDSIVGTWVFKDTLTFNNAPYFYIGMFYRDVQPEYYGRIYIDGADRIIKYDGPDGRARYDDGWDDSVYQTITILNDQLFINDTTSNSIDDFIEWLKANAIKQ